MTHRHKIIKPFLVKGRPFYHIEYWDGDKRLRRSLGTSVYETALLLAEAKIGYLPIRPTKPRHEKAAKDPDMYIYYRKPYTVRVGKDIVGHANTRAEARRLKDEYFQGRMA